MRKILFALVTTIALFATNTTVEAQVRFGIRGGLNLTKANFNSDDFRSSNNAGFFIGPTLEAKIPVLGLGADISVIYDNKKTKIIKNEDSSASQDTESKTTNNIDLPINVRWNFGTPYFDVYVATGPQFSWCIDGQKIKEIFGTSQYTIKSSVFSWNIGAGFSFAKHFRLGYTYNIGCGNTAEIQDSKDVSAAVEKNYNLKNNSHQIHLTYFFF